jgi:AraC-like DNA-binding protein
MASVVEISTRDPERALPTLEGYFPGVRMSNPHGDFALRLVAAEVDAVSIIKYRLKSPASSSSADLSENFTFGHVDIGSMGLVTEDAQIVTAAPWLFPESRVHASWDDVTITAMTVSRSATIRMARAQTGRDAAELSFIGTAPIDAERGRRWTSFVKYTRESMAGTPSTPDSPILRTSSFAHLVGLMLDTFPNTLTELLHQQSRLVAAPSSVRRALQFIEQNAHTPITAHDIACESRMSVRALQYAFQRHLGTTPVAHLRRVRLDGAHSELQRADPTTGATVLGVAARWGFSHPGRFATQYREAYGVSPKHTLDS